MTAAIEHPVSAHPLQRQRMMYGDPIRVLGTLAVVLGHCCDMPMGYLAPESRAWWICNAANCLARWAVPVYVMLSGALLLDPAREESPRTFYRKRLARLGVPLVFWSLFFMAFDVYHNNNQANHWGTTWPKAWANLALGQPYPHLHFVYRIAVLYAFTPMFRVFVRHATRRMLVASMLVLFAIWSADSMINAFNGTSLSAFARFAPFVSYYLAGYVLREMYLSKAQLKWAVVVFAASAAVMAVVTGMLTMQYGFKWYPSVPLILYDFLSPVRIPLAISAWLILITVFRQEGRLTKVWGALAPTTLGLYLIHPMFREILHVNGYGVTWPNIYLGVPLITLSVYFASLISVVVLMRIPVVRRIAL